MTERIGAYVRLGSGMDSERKRDRDGAGNDGGRRTRSANESARPP